MPSHAWEYGAKVQRLRNRGDTGYRPVALRGLSGGLSGPTAACGGGKALWACVIRLTRLGIANRNHAPRPGPWAIAVRRVSYAATKRILSGSNSAFLLHYLDTLIGVR